jgi:phytoene desaturase
VKNDFLRRCFSFHPLLVGGNPFDTTSIYAMIHYLEREWGVHYAKGGTGALCKRGPAVGELGGKVHLNTAVSEILVDESRRVTGIRLEDGTIHRPTTSSPMPTWPSPT